MQIILKQDIATLGKKDQIVTVNDGYARNYLLPRGMAVAATADNLNDARNKQLSIENKKQKEKDYAKNTAESLKGVSVKVNAKIGENGKLFGAVSAKDISEAIESQYKITVDKKKISLEEPIKTAGDHTVEIKLAAGISVKITVSIIQG